MLNQLIESKDNQKGNRAGFLLTTFVLVTGLFFSAIVWSLFAKDLGMGTDSLELSTLVAPLPAAEKPPELPVNQEKSELNNVLKNSVPTRRENILQISESPITPNKISVAPNTQKARPNGYVLIADNVEIDGGQNAPTAIRGGGTGAGSGIENNASSSSSEQPEEIKIPPPLMKKTPVETPRKSIVKSGGVINGQAKLLPKPIYSAAAKAVKASGSVSVQVLIDEAGNVVSATAVNGHPLLKGEAEKAARNAKFNPTLLTGQPVKVSGIIVYKFSMP